MFLYHCDTQSIEHVGEWNGKKRLSDVAFGDSATGLFIADRTGDIFQWPNPFNSTPSTTSSNQPSTTSSQSSVASGTDSSQKSGPAVLVGGHCNTVTALQLTGGLLCSADKGNKIRLSNRRCVSDIYAFLLGHRSAVTCLAAAGPGSSWLASGDAAGAVCLWDTAKPDTTPACDFLLSSIQFSSETDEAVGSMTWCSERLLAVAGNTAPVVKCFAVEPSGASWTLTHRFDSDPVPFRLQTIVFCSFPSSDQPAVLLAAEAQVEAAIPFTGSLDQILENVGANDGDEGQDDNKKGDDQSSSGKRRRKHKYVTYGLSKEAVTTAQQEHNAKLNSTKQNRLPRFCTLNVTNDSFGESKLINLK